MEPLDSEVITLGEYDGDDIGSPLAHDSSHIVGDPNFAPIAKVPVEILAEIFVQCLIPSCQYVRLVPYKSEFGIHPQIIREQLGQVCRLWNTIVDNEPRIWATFILYDEFLDPEMVSLWIKKSRSHPLDVFFWSQPREKQDERWAIHAMLRKEFSRIHILFGDFSKWDVSALFPLDVLTEAPMMQTFILWGYGIYKGADIFGGVHCPQLHSLSVTHFQGISLFVKPMENVHQLNIGYYGGPIHLYFEILDLLPNLVSLTWRDGLEEPFLEELPKVNLRSLRFLTVACGKARITSYLACFLSQSPDTFSEDGNINLRYLRLEDGIPRETKIPAILHQLKHLMTLTLASQYDRNLVDALLLALSPPDQDFSSVCPQLKTVELTDASFSPSALEHFIKRRVKSDFDDLAPALVTSLALAGHSLIGEELRAQFAQTHSSSITFTEIPVDFSCPACACVLS